jgi:hypothetical protein
MVWNFKKMRICSSKFIWDASDANCRAYCATVWGLEYDGEISKRKRGWDLHPGHPLDDYKFEMKYFVTRS